jgi:hypothetical protein
VEEDNSVARELWFGQCLLLGSIGMTYSGNKRLFEISEIMRNTPITFVRRNGSLASTTSIPRNIASDSDTMKDKVWKSWVKEELRIRLGFAVFVYAHLVDVLGPCLATNNSAQFTASRFPNGLESWLFAMHVTTRAKTEAACMRRNLECFNV